MNSYVSARGGIGLGTCRSSVPNDRTETGRRKEIERQERTGVKTLPQIYCNTRIPLELYQLQG